MTKRYVELNSVGAFLDTKNLDILPMTKNGTIMFSERRSIDQVDNKEWYQSLSNEDDNKLRKAAKEYESKIKTLRIYLNNKEKT